MSKVISIATVESVREVLTDSLAVIFKHSTRCPISAGAKREVVRNGSVAWYASQRSITLKALQDAVK